MATDGTQQGRERPVFDLGLPQVRLVLAFALIVAATTVLVDAARYTFVTPGGFPRETESLLAYRTLPEPPDVLLLGSSRFDDGLDGRLVQETLSEQLGREVSVYKVAQRGLRSWILHSILRDYVVPDPPKRVLVLGMDLQLFEPPLTARALRQAGRLRDVEVLGDVELTAPQWRALLALPFRGLQVIAAVPWMLQPEIRETIAYAHAHSGELSEEADARLRELEQRHLFEIGYWDVELAVERSFDYRFHGGWFDDVERILAELPCDVLLVRTPVHSDFVAGAPPETWERYFERVRGLCEDHGFEFVDMNEPPFARGDEDMSDRVHVTERAQARLSRMLARRVLAPRLR